MANTKVSAAGAIAMANALAALFNAGSGPATIKLYTGTQPADPDAGIGGGTLLGTLVMSDPAYGAATDGNPGGVIVADVIAADLVADATGTLTWFRKADSDGNGILDGDAGETAEDLVANTASVVAGSTLSVSDDTVTVPQS